MNNDTTRSPACDCGNPLQKVRQSPNSMLNAEQFDAARAGDWFCEACPNQPGVKYRYFWNSTLPRAVVRTSPALSDKQEAERELNMDFENQEFNAWVERELDPNSDARLGIDMGTDHYYDGWMARAKLTLAAPQAKSAPSGESIATWRERIGAPTDARAEAYTDVSEEMQAEIADLRAALARRATAGTTAAPIYQIYDRERDAWDDYVKEDFDNTPADQRRIVYLAGNAAQTDAEATEVGASALRAEPAGQHGDYDRAFDSLYGAVMNIECKPDAGWGLIAVNHYKFGHRDARHASADLVAEFASRFRALGRNACNSASSDLASSAAAPGDLTDVEIIRAFWKQSGRDYAPGDAELSNRKTSFGYFFSYGQLIDAVREVLASTARAAPLGAEPELYECIGKGGVYEFVGCSNGAGEKRGETIVVYSDTRTKDVLYHRTVDDFYARMRRINAAPSPASQAASQVGAPKEKDQ